MKCSKCKVDLEEKYIQLSHDIPKYIGGTDLDGRSWLCEECHKEYEILVLKKILKWAGEEFIEEEIINFMVEIKKQPENFKEHCRILAIKCKEEFFSNG